MPSRRLRIRPDEAGGDDLGANRHGGDHDRTDHDDGDDRGLRIDVVDRDDTVADEVPVALVFNGISHAVMMASPVDLEDFAIGFAFTERIIDGIDDLRDIDSRVVAMGAEVQIEISPACLWRLKQRRRALTGRTGCGLCGLDSLDEFRQQVPAVDAPPVTIAALLHAQRELGRRQPMRERTGATHAAAWCRLDGTIEIVREDVGRHNALDKLIGALLRADGQDVDRSRADRPGLDDRVPDRPRAMPPATPDRREPRNGFALISSRASYEMIDKAARASIGAVAAVSAPTGLAIDRAREAGLLLAAFVRDRSLTVYHGDVMPGRRPPRRAPGQPVR